MTLDYFAMEMKISVADPLQRKLSGYAAVHSNLDRVRDIIDPGASAKAVARLKAPSDVELLVGHNQADLPVGIPTLFQATPHGLYMEAYVLKGPVGDNLLAVAKDLQEHGHALGFSIGYKTRDSTYEQTAHGRARRLLDYDLKEVSVASRHAIANPLALVTDVKSKRGHKALSEGADTAGGALVPAGRSAAARRGRSKSMQYRVEQRGQQWAVVCDADADGDEDDGQVIGTYDSQDTATLVALALRKGMGLGDTDDDAPAGKTEPAAPEIKAEWSTAYVNDLPDSAFLFVESGGQKDSENKTVPRAKRHLPYKDASGKIDPAHLKNAIARIPVTQAEGLDDGKKAQLQARARRMLASMEGADGKTTEEPEEWKTGSPLAVYHLACRLQDLSERMATDLKAMVVLAEETKGYQVTRPSSRQTLRAIGHDLTILADHLDRVAADEDGAAQVRLLRAELELMRL